MKPKLSPICLILIFLLTMNVIISVVNARKFSNGLGIDDKLIWKCNICKKSEMNVIFGTDWDDSGIFENISKGARMKWEIIKSEANETHIIAEFSLWMWTIEEDWGIIDHNSTIVYLSNPEDYFEVINFSNYKSLVPFWFPTPIGEYMGGLNLNNWYDVDNRVLPTLNVEIGKNEISLGNPTKNIKIIAIYNDNGALNSYKLYIKGNVVVLDISLDYLPWYVIPTLIILLVIFSLGIIFYIIRKRNRAIIS